MFRCVFFFYATKNDPKKPYASLLDKRAELPRPTDRPRTTTERHGWHLSRIGSSRISELEFGATQSECQDSDLAALAEEERKDSGKGMCVRATNTSIRKDCPNEDEFGPFIRIGSGYFPILDSD